MRNGVLGVLGEMLSQVLRPDKMDSEQMKSIRDQCLDRLEVWVWVWVCGCEYVI